MAVATARIDSPSHRVLALIGTMVDQGRAIALTRAATSASDRTRT